MALKTVSSLNESFTSGTIAKPPTDSVGGGEEDNQKDDKPTPDADVLMGQE